MQISKKKSEIQNDLKGIKNNFKNVNYRIEILVHIMYIRFLKNMFKIVKIQPFKKNRLHYLRNKRFK